MLLPLAVMTTTFFPSITIRISTEHELADDDTRYYSDKESDVEGHDSEHPSKRLAVTKKQPLSSSQQIAYEGS
jgi:hypothetical protein